MIRNFNITLMTILLVHGVPNNGFCNASSDLTAANMLSMAESLQ